MKRWLGLVMLCFGVSVMGAEVTWEDAEVAVKGWSRDAGNTLEEDFEGKEVLGTSVFEDDDGNVIFYAVEFVGGGFVVTSTDDTLEPIVAFSATGSLVQDDRNPLWVMLHAEMSVRTKAAREKNEKAPRGMRAFAEGSFQANSQSRWRALMAAGKSGGVHASGLSSVSDVRVSPLVQSTWGQSNGIYNYYTPNQYVCGCVATAMAQVMRFHQYPTRSVSAKTRMCEVDGVSMSLTMKGGYYDWSNMPLSPGDSATTTQKQAIGKLTYDCGVSVYMDYTWYGSGAGGGMPAIAFETVFGYSNARGITVNGNLSATVRERAILANLDAGCPVLLGIEGNGGNGGHEVVGDGYGYNGSVCYVHLNMGWNGSDDAWYNLPNVDDHSYGFSIVDTVVYNIFPNRIGELLTGRVTDSSGNPLSGVMVSAGSASTLTNERGIYALYVNGGNTYTVTASKGSSSKSVSVSVSTSSNTVYSEPSFYTPGTGSVGNSWGNNFTLQPSAPANPPSAPTGVSATDGSSTANVGISWSSVSGATGYEVHRATSSGGTKTKLATVTGTSYTDTGATPGAVYYYWVKTLKGSESSGFSSSDTGYRKLSAPTVTASTTDSAKVSVSCTAVTGATHYRLSRATSSSGSKSVIGSWQTGRTWSDTSAVVGTTYYYFVEAAVDASGTRPSAYSSGEQGKRIEEVPTTPPNAPSSVTATLGDSTANVSIHWGSVGGATGYEVYRATSSTGTKTKLATVTGTSYTDTSANAGTLYYYSVKATNAAGSSEWSIPNTGYRKLSAPTVTASTEDSTKVSVSCTSVTGATHYRLSRATSTSGSKSVIGEWQTDRTWSDTSATLGTTYYYYVEAAVDALGTRPSAYSISSTGKRPVEGPSSDPTIPSNVKATDGTATNHVLVSWSAVSGAESYDVYRSTTTSGSKTRIKAAETGTSYSDTTASAGTLYYYWVRANLSSGVGSFSDWDAGYKRLSITTVTASTNYVEKVLVSCTQVTGASYYRLSRSTSSSGTKTIIGDWQTSRSWEDTSGVVGTSYYYFVEAATSAEGLRPSDYSVPVMGARSTIEPEVAPNPPTHVKASDGISTNHVEITWSAPSGATSYEVYRSTTSSGSKTRIKKDVEIASYMDTTASAGTVYYYWVKANNAQGSSNFSDPDTGYKRLTTARVTASTTDLSNVIITCTSVTGAKAYRLSRATSITGTKTVIDTWQTGRSWTDTTASVDTDYYYFVEAAMDATGLRPSAYSEYAVGRRPSVAPPSAPTGLMASDGASTAHVSITWTVVSGATGYEVYRASSSSDEKTMIKTVSSASATDTSATPGFVYTYWVVATNKGGSSSYSSADTGYRKLTAPTVSAGTTAASAITVSCTPVSGATHYRLARATSATGSKSALGPWQTGCTWSDASAEVDTTYYYFVEAAVSSSGLRSSGYGSYATGKRTREPQEFRIQSVEISPDGTTLSLSFVSETGKTYRVQRTDSLSPIAWTTVETITPTTTGSLTRTYSLPSNKDSGFYRVVRIE